MADASQITRGLGDTIVAISSPRGSGRRGIVRLSGDHAIAFADQAFESVGTSQRPRELDWQATSGRLIVGRAGVSTPVVAYVMRGPRSYTGEDQVELHLPGSPTLLEMVVEILRRMGARLALPGEFTQRAFRNGRIDLTKAEAVAATIHARSEGERLASLGILAGDRAREIRAYGDRIASFLASVELDLDFSDQDIDIVEPEGLSQSIQELATELRVAAGKPGVDRRRMSRRRVLLVGKSNAGKSSLFNTLIGNETAIVSHIKGTTRDFLEAEIDVNGTQIVLVDTAGDDFLSSEVDREAHRLRARESAQADFVVRVVNALSLAEDEPVSDDNSAVLVSHVDRQEGPSQASNRRPQDVWFSSVTKEGVGDVQTYLQHLVSEGEKGSDQALVHLDQRHREGFAAAAAALERSAETSAQLLGLELVAADLHEALRCMRILTGEEYTEEILDRIMRDFCVGK